MTTLPTTTTLDMKHFLIRQDPEANNEQQIISTSSDGWLKIQPVDQQFVNLFSNLKLMTSELTDVTYNQKQNVESDESGSTQRVIEQAVATHYELMMSEFSRNDVKDIFDKVIFDDKEVD